MSPKPWACRWAAPARAGGASVPTTKRSAAWPRRRRDGVDRLRRVAAAEGQHLQRVPAEHALGRRQAGLAPAGPPRGRRGRRPRRCRPAPRARGRDGRRPQALHADAPRPDQAGDGVGQHRARVAQQAAPVARVVAAVAQRQHQVEVGHAARAQEHRGPVGAQARAVAGDQHVGGQRRALRGAELGQAGRAGLLAHLHQPLGVEAQPPARAASTAPSAAMLMLCWPLLSAVPRPYQRSPSPSACVSVQGSRPSAHWPSWPRTTSPWP
jgi:hypothetical protein